MVLDPPASRPRLADARDLRIVTSEGMLVGGLEDIVARQTQQSVREPMGVSR